MIELKAKKHPGAGQTDDIGRTDEKIDTLVYRLYNLTWEEIKVIEPKFPLSKAEYEGIRAGE